jgi:Zn-dependent peptidase ImmA (M78 family)
MDKASIEQAARSLRRLIWDRQDEFWPDSAPNAMDVLNPEVAARGNFGQAGIRFEIAGLIDRQSRKIAISRRFPPEVRRFTAAHEIGHWLLHPGEVMHRDKPIQGMSTYFRPPIEAEADYFAACFLMPERALTKKIEETFGVSVPISFTEDMAFWLAPGDSNHLVYPDQGSRAREFAMAAATSFAGRHFHSLAEQFGVSVSSMAFRLDELGLIAKYP